MGSDTWRQSLKKETGESAGLLGPLCSLGPLSRRVWELCSLLVTGTLFTIHVSLWERSQLLRQGD